MASIVPFHSALGLTTGTKSFADTLARDGHTVLTPDLFDGETFSTVEDGVRKRDALGIPELMQRAARSVEGAPAVSLRATRPLSLRRQTAGSGHAHRHRLNLGFLQAPHAQCRWRRRSKWSR
jgi:dienelactone hydrolase